MWIDNPHVCELPMTAHGSVAKIGAWFECGHCHANWKVQARVNSKVESFYDLTWIRREGDRLISRSHLEQS